MNEQADNLELRRKLLLVSAIPYALDADGPKANSFTILKHAITCAGLWTGQMSKSQGGYPEVIDPVFESWYATLIEMSTDKADVPRMFDPFGNTLLPAQAHFTACYLTDYGRTLAEAIAKEHPEWLRQER
jgi:hypothetical protein